LFRVDFALNGADVSESRHNGQNGQNKANQPIKEENEIAQLLLEQSLPRYKHHNRKDKHDASKPTSASASVETHWRNLARNFCKASKKI
jgi:hypothetical protein